MAYQGRDAVIVGAVRTPVGKGKAERHTTRRAARRPAGAQSARAGAARTAWTRCRSTTSSPEL